MGERVRIRPFPQVELAIFAELYGAEISVTDIQSGRADCYGQGQGHARRVYMLFSGIHFDAATVGGARSRGWCSHFRHGRNVLCFCLYRLILERSAQNDCIAYDCRWPGARSVAVGASATDADAAVAALGRERRAAGGFTDQATLSSVGEPLFFSLSGVFV